MKRLFVGACALALAASAAGCGDDARNTTTSANLANANAAAAVNAEAGNTAAGERAAPDNSVIATETAGGVTTETRTFRDPKSRVERVVVTTRDGRRTARVYYRDRTVKELPESEVGQVMGMTADAIYGAGGKVVDVTKDAGSAVADKVEDVPNEVDDAARAAGGAAKRVGAEVGDKAEDVGGAAASGAKKAGKATVKGARKVGGAVKDALTP